MSLDDKGADNHEVYPRATGPLSLTDSKMRLFRNLDQKTLTSPEKVQMTTLVTKCYQALSLTNNKCDFSGDVKIGRAHV